MPNNPESITVSLEWAKKMKELGWPQNKSYFNYHESSLAVFNVQKTGKGMYEIFNGIDAPTAEEIFRELPNERSPNEGSPREIALQAWSCGDLESLSDAAAVVWCFLAENNLFPKQ